MCLNQFCHNFDRLNHIHGHDDDHQGKGGYNLDQLEHKNTRGITFACMKPSFRLSLTKMHWNGVNSCRNCILHPPIKIIKAGRYYHDVVVVAVVVV